ISLCGVGARGPENPGTASVWLDAMLLVLQGHGGFRGAACLCKATGIAPHGHVAGADKPRSLTDRGLRSLQARPAICAHLTSRQQSVAGSRRAVSLANRLQSVKCWPWR